MKRRGDVGAAAVEFALLLPVVLLVIFGIIDFGRMLNAQITLTEAAREAARATALADATSGQARFDEATQSLTGAGVTLTDCHDGNPDAIADAAYTFDFVTPLGILIGGDGTLQLTGHGVMPCLH